MKTGSIKKMIVITISVFIFISNLVMAQTMKHKLENVVVTAGKTPVSFSDLTRTVQVISAKEIKAIPANSVPELLKFAASVDVRQRGVEGVQADVSIRGGGYEQTLILIDGVKVNDAQTGHHNMNIPVSMENIERIEILKGQGSRLYGPNAFSGVINIITKKSQKKNAKLHITTAQNATYGAEVNLSLPVGKYSQTISAGKKRSNGYMHNTGYEILNLSYNSTLTLDKSVFRVFAGYTDKEFGANSFYTTAFPNQWEAIKTTFANVSGEFAFDKVFVTTKGYWRKNEDEFLLKYDNPSFYRNLHETNTYGFELQATIESRLGSTSIGGEVSKDEIESNSLKNHDRSKTGFFAEHKFTIAERLNIIVGGFAYDYAEIGWKFWPGIDASYKINNNMKVFGSIGKAFRIPTFTDLYYVSPANMGNPDLKHEETVNYEIGFNYNSGLINTGVSFFRKEGKNIIDWVRELETEPWQVRNIADINTNGIELNFEIIPTNKIKNCLINRASLSYTYLDSERESSNVTSKYVLGNLKHQVIFNLSNKLVAGINQNWAMRYEERVNSYNHLLLDTKLSKSFEKFDLFLSVNNIFDADHSDVGGVPLPGRWFSGGFNINLF
ncbi:MAG: TonB-dependent receptor plug domain-containing protein [Rhodothermaceae bacterium]